MSDFVLDPNYHSNLMALAEQTRGEVLDDIAEDARRFAPVDTGEMRDSIQVNGDRVEVGTDHWNFVEFGTRYMDAQPFLGPALYRTRGQS